MDERTPIAGTVHTVHVVFPHSGRSLCGHEEERPRPEGAAASPCPECVALLRSGLVVGRSRNRWAAVSAPVDPGREAPADEESRPGGAAVGLLAVTRS